ncbi:MAG: ThiF family adenylyltransferase [Parvibaculum sp.]
MTWWLIRSTQLSNEKAAIATLEGTVDWLRVGKWQANKELAMCVDFQIVHNDSEFAFQMIYPSVFPDAPPMIYTEDRSRISYHQYGPDGELCLEYRPDNWLPSITGADMITSCHRLLAAEQPETDVVVYAQSAHVASLGRDLRSKPFRFLLSAADVEALKNLASCEPELLSLRERLTTSTVVASLAFIGCKDAALWTSDLVLPIAARDVSGFVVHVPGAENSGDISAEELKAILDGGGLCDLSKSLFDEVSSTHLLMGDGDNWELFWIYGEAEDRKVVAYSTVRIPVDRQRLPEFFSMLVDKRVGIVGCGSMGSKIAASLCRTGVGKFLLIDEDIFFPGNVVRNELDLNDTGAHKSFALRDRLRELNPQSDVIALRLSLGGQESANSMASALSTLGDCDLLIDATAQSIAFNLIASVSTRRRRPMIWAEVFAGGIGGFVARARPDIDPVPLEARGQIEVWCADQGVKWARPNGFSPYDGQDENEQPLIAEDAEVAIIASHAARFATDILARSDASIFPQSAYVIGLSSQWLFDQPFDTRPIDLRPGGPWGEAADLLEPEEMVKLLNEHWISEEGSDATPVAE